MKRDDDELTNTGDDPPPTSDRAGAAHGEPPATRPASNSGAPAPGPTSAQERQIRFLKGVTVILFCGLIGLGGVFAYIRHENRPVTIIVEGKPVATLQNMTHALAVMDTAEHAILGADYPAGNVIRMQKVQFERTAGDAPVDDEATAQRSLAGVLKLKVRAYVIKVDGHPSIGLPTSEAATDTIALVKDHFAQMPPNAPIVGSPVVRQRLVVDRMPIPVSLARKSADDAAPYFWTAPPVKTYIVQAGDRGYNIAIRHHISFTDFLAANAGKNLNHLMPGDVVNLQKTHPTIAVMVKKKISANEPIIADADPDDAGKRHVVYVATYTDGIETSRDVISMVTLTRPRPRERL